MANQRDASICAVIRAAISSTTEATSQIVEQKLREARIAREQAELAAALKYMLDNHNVTAKMHDVIMAYDITKSTFQRMTGLGRKTFERITKRTYRVWDIRTLISIIAGFGAKISILEACEWLDNNGYQEESPEYYLYYYLVRNYHAQPYQEWNDFCMRYNLPALGSK